jgi:hypothetical protein
MSAKYLVAAANSSPGEASYLSLEHEEDDIVLPPAEVTHTYGTGGEYVTLPVVMNASDFVTKRATIAAKNGTWVLSFWVNHDDLLVYTFSSSYDDSFDVPNSRDWSKVALFVQYRNGEYFAHLTNWGPK